MESLKEIIEIVKQLEQTSSTNGKEFILKKNKDNKLLKKTLFFTYCKDYQYGIKKTTINKMRFDIDDSNKWNNNIFKMLEELANSNINNELTKEVQGLLTFYEKDIRELIIRILLKDLRIGVNVKTINKAISGLIPKHEIMLASKFEGKLKGKVSMSLKMDGIRCSILIDEEGNTKYLSRQGARINGLKELDKEVRALGLTNTFVDGELIRKNINNLSSDDNFSLTTKVVNSNSEDKRGLEFVVFDMTSLKEYQEGKSNTPYEKRLKQMEQTIKEGNYIRLVEKFGVTDDVNTIYEILNEVVSNGLEGLMLNTLDGKYGFGKRSKDILKVKKFQSCDIRCLRIEEGTGKYEGKLGKIICNYKGYELGVGSGFDDNEREFYWNNPDEIIGKIVEVKYFEESENQNGGLSLRFPIFKTVRKDKNDESYN